MFEVDIEFFFYAPASPFFSIALYVKKNCTPFFLFLYSLQLFSSEDHDLFLCDTTYISSFSFLSFFLPLSTCNKVIELSFVITSLSPSFLYCQHHLLILYINFFSSSTITLQHLCIVERQHTFFSSLHSFST